MARELDIHGDSGLFGARTAYVRTRVLCLILLAVTLSSCSTPMSATPPEASSTGQPTMLPHTLTAPVVPEPVVHLAWFFKPPRQIPIEALPAAFDVFILTHKDEAARDRLRANGRGGPILQYLMLAEIMDPGDCTSDPYGNQVAYRAGDFCEISAQHPDWFLLDQAGKRVRGASGKYYMDPGNPEFRSFWLERAKKLQAEFGWDGLFIDNVEASRTKFTSRGISLRAYPDEFSFQAAVDGFLAYVEHGYSKPSGKPMLANIVSVADDATWFRYLGHLDGAMMESFATDQSDGRLGSAEWEEQMKLVERALAEGKSSFLSRRGGRQIMTFSATHSRPFCSLPMGMLRSGTPTRILTLSPGCTRITASGSAVRLGRAIGQGMHGSATSRMGRCLSTRRLAVRRLWFTPEHTQRLIGR